MLPGRFTSGAAKATVVGGKTPTQGVMVLSDTINPLPGMGAHIFPALLLFCSPSCWSAGMSCGVGGRGHKQGLCPMQEKQWCCRRTLAVLLVSRLSSVSNFQGN